MKQIFEEEQIVGKEITKVGLCDAGLILHFAGGDFIVFEAQGYPDDVPYIIVEDQKVFPPNETNFGVAHMFDLITEEEYFKYIEINNKAQKKVTENLERQQYERLKEKFG